MSSNDDSTQPSDEGRSVATDADLAPSSPGAGGGAATPGPNGSAGRSGPPPSPTPRAVTPDNGGPRPSGDGDVPAPRGEGTEAEAPAEPAVQSGTVPWGSADGAGSATPEPVAEVAPESPSPESPSPELPSPESETSVAPGSGQASAAVTPPPWRRVPGDHPAEPEPPEPERPSVADSLLSEAPTAFLTAPGAAGAGAADAPEGATTIRERGGAEPSIREEQAQRAARNRPPRQALLQLKRLDPWSVLKMALALAVVLFLVWMVAAGVLYGVLGGMGVWDRLNGTYADLVTGQTQNAGSLISAGRVFLLAAVVGAINSLLFAVALTIVAFVYNVAADLVGGIEVTLSERD